MEAGDALDFALGREAFVEPVLAELARHLSPGAEARFPARHAPGFGLGIVARGSAQTRTIALMVTGFVTM